MIKSSEQSYAAPFEGLNESEEDMSACKSGVTILVIEDDEKISEPLLFGLEKEGFCVIHASDGRTGLELSRTASPSVILLDLMLPDISGLEVCRVLRQESAVPILILTARGQEMDRVMGLEVGADDYIVKPFSFRELVARVRAVLRRRELDRVVAASHTAPDHLSIGKIVLDRKARQVWKDGTPVELSYREYELLRVLMENAGVTLSRQELLDKVWGESWIGDPRTLDVHIHWLREKLEDVTSSPQYIQTVRGYGYRFQPPSAS